MLNSYLLCPASITYKLGAAFHRNLYKIKMLQKDRLRVPVIGVGNLSFGGSGKTLVTKAIAEKLSAEGISVGIVSRSYGAEPGPHILENGSADPSVVGDEAVLLYSEIGRRNVGVASGRDKTAAAAHLIERRPDLQVLIVDDAFQHHKLHQDLTILIWPKPGSLTREFLGAEKHADILLVPNGCRSPRPDSETIYFVKEILGLRPSVRIPERLLLVSGLGPESNFCDSVRGWLGSLGPRRITELSFPDHVDYRRPEVQARLIEMSRECDAIVTTGKDAVKLNPLALDLPPIYVVQVGIRFLTNGDLMWKKIDAAITKKG